MIYKCTKCKKGIECKGVESESISCNCKNISINNSGKMSSVELSRTIDSERWRKISEEPPEEGEGYSHVICMIEFGDNLYELSFEEVKQINYSIDVDMYPYAEWRPVYWF